MDTKEIKALLREECDYFPPEEIVDLFLNSMEEIHLRPKETLIAAGKRNHKVFILTDGVIRQVYRDEYGEHTRAFATAGTLFLSYPGYCINQPALMSIETCCESTCLVCDRTNFDKFMTDYPQFALWQLHLAYIQLYFYETKLSVIKGKAKDRLQALLKARPVILEKVPLGVIASYLGITQVHLSRLRRELLR